MKVGIFGSEYQIERQNLIKRLFEKLREQEADIYVDSSHPGHCSGQLDT